MADETIALLMTDLEDSTRGWYQSQKNMLELVEAYIDLVERRLQPPPRIESFTGDGHLLSFPTVDAAAAAALRLREFWEQRRASFGRVQWSETHRLRMGIHVGRVVRLADGRIVGSPINVCARTMSAAHPGEVLVSDAAVQDFRAKDRFEIGPPRLRALKGIHSPPSSIDELFGIQAAGTFLHPLLGLSPVVFRISPLPEEVSLPQFFRADAVRHEYELEQLAHITGEEVDAKTALRLAEDMRAMFPESASAYVALWNALGRNGDIAGAERALARATDLLEKEFARRRGETEYPATSEGPSSGRMADADQPPPGVGRLRRARGKARRAPARRKS